MTPGAYRDRFLIPSGPDGDPGLYFCGNSLGPQPRAAAQAIEAELERWACLGVAAHLDGPLAWVPYHRLLTPHLAELAGARESEVVAMNSLTVNLHLMMVSFYRPRGDRCRILIEQGAFPSDRHAVASQLAFHGFDPRRDLVELDAGEDGLVREERVEDYLAAHGETIALVLWPGVHYATGQVFDLGRISRAARAAGAVVGFDLAHAIGNVPLNLHDDEADFAVWCSYKYLNAGPGAVGGCFVHRRHEDFNGPRFAGWWGHEEASRFRMGADFKPAAGAEGWQLSNPPILAMAPLRTSLEIFHEAGMGALRRASLDLTGRLAAGLREAAGAKIRILTPLEPQRRACQLSLRVGGEAGAGMELFRRLEARGVGADSREPDILRVAPAPLYNTVEEVDALVDLIAELA